MTRERVDKGAERVALNSRKIRRSVAIKVTYFIYLIHHTTPLSGNLLYDLLLNFISMLMRNALKTKYGTKSFKFKSDDLAL